VPEQQLVVRDRIPQARVELPGVALNSDLLTALFSEPWQIFLATSHGGQSGASIYTWTRGSVISALSLRRPTGFEPSFLLLRGEQCLPGPTSVWDLKVVSSNPAQSSAVRSAPVSRLSLAWNSSHARRRASGSMAAAVG